MPKGISRKIIKNPIAYIVKDKVFGKLEVLNSDSAWWLERAKVENLIVAYKIDSSVEECCTNAGITYDQYKYFIETHPYVSTVKVLCSQLLTIKARQTVGREIEKNYQNAMDYLKRKRKKEFGDSLDVDSNITISHVISRIRAIKGRGNNGVSGQGEALVELPDSQ